MQCPNCNMNIKDDAQFCLHCGTQFANRPVAPVQTATAATCPKCNAAIAPGTQFCTNCGFQIQGAQSAQTPDQILQQKQQVIAQEQIQREKYMRAYFGSGYDSVMEGSFSIGTFFFGWVWLIIYKLYSAAGKMFVTQVVINFVAVILSPLLGGFGTILGGTASLWITIMYAREFSSAYLDRANHEIDYILSTVPNEEDRLKECKKAGGPSLIAGIVVVGAFLGIIALIFFSAVMGAGSTIEHSRQDTFMDTSRAYVNAIKNAVYADEIKCGKNIYEADAGIYYYSFTTRAGDSATKILEMGGKSSWNNADVAGQVIIHKSISGGRPNYKFAVVLVDEKGKGIGEFTNDGKVTAVVSETLLRRSDVNTSDGDNRKAYFNKVASGSTSALNSVGPTLNTEWDYTPLRNLYGKDQESIKTEPVACEYIG